MKYCEKCGTQMPDDTVMCPQCHPENIQHSQPIQITTQKNLLKYPSRKITAIIITNIIISVVTLIATIGMYFISPSNQSNNDTKNNTVCPASQYGNHDWSNPTCINPAQCRYCDAYRDDKLGQHFFYTGSDGHRDCSYCGILYEVYIDSLE